MNRQASPIDDLLRNPTVEKAIKHYEALRKRMGWPYPADATLEVVALASVHKARLAWPDSTKRMVKESKAWLIEHGMTPTLDSTFHGTVQ